MNFPSMYFLLFLSVASCSTPSSEPQNKARVSLSSEGAADILASDLKSANSVNFFFLTWTEDYSLNPDALKSESTIRVYRACGANCTRYMDFVVRHLRDSRRVECLPGQEDVLIDFGTSHQIIYSYSGRQISYKGNCYFNSNSIRDVVKNSPFPF